MNRWTSVCIFSALSIATCSTALGQREVGHAFPVVLKDALDPNSTDESTAEKVKLQEVRIAFENSKAANTKALDSKTLKKPQRKLTPPGKRLPETQVEDEKTKRFDPTMYRSKKSEPEASINLNSMLKPILESDQKPSSTTKPMRPGQPLGNIYQSPRVIMPPTPAPTSSPMAPRKINSSVSGFNLNDERISPRPPLQKDLQKGIRVANRHVENPPAGTFMNFRSDSVPKPPAMPSRSSTIRLTDEIPTLNIKRPSSIPNVDPPTLPKVNQTPRAERPTINFSDDSALNDSRPGNSILKRREPVASAKVVLLSKIIGPESLTANEPDEFEVMITNSSDNPATNVIVRLSVPNDITITNLDRDAVLDHASRSVSWKVRNIAPGQSEWIRYQAISSTPGSHPQVLTLGTNNTFQGKTSFTTRVLPSIESETRVAGADSNTWR